MTPEQKLKHAMLLIAIGAGSLEFTGEITVANVDSLWAELASNDLQFDLMEEFRSCGVETGLTAPYSRDTRHYESCSVASQMPDGSWVGWTHWYGGGKHSQPSAIPWMDEAYDLNCTEVPTVVMVQTFTRPADAPKANPLES